MARPRETSSEKKIWTIANVLSWAVDDFKERRLTKPRLEAEVLLSAALGVERLRLYTHFDAPLDADELEAFREYVRRRRSGEPSAYITGAKEFWSRRFAVDPSVLIPRPETETLVQVALDELPKSSPWRLADLGTGSGVVAVTLACELPAAFVDATDLSEAALNAAHANAVRHGVEKRVSLLKGDLAAPLDPAIRYDAVFSNPPYIPTSDIQTLEAGIRDFEPVAALDGGPDGLMAIERLVVSVPDHLKPGGLLAFEIGAGQSRAALDFLARSGQYRDMKTTQDLAGIDRVVSARSAAC